MSISNSMSKKLNQSEVEKKIENYDISQIKRFLLIHSDCFIVCLFLIPSINVQI